MKYQVLLYYKYVSISNPEKVKKEQRRLCEKLNLKGRIIVALEGINGTVEGKLEDTEEYILDMEKNEIFKGISYKKSTGTGNAFPKLKVRVRPEIVTAGLSNINPNEVSGKYISAEELNLWFKEKKEFFVIDMRNDYEYASGYFDNFIPSGMRNFFELKQVLPKLLHLRDKVIVTVCTGGVRCEKASGFLLSNGFKNVYQLNGGIQTYLEKFPNKNFKGKLYVFDNRLTLGFNTEDSSHEVVGKCMHCKKSCDSYVNCAYNFCHLHYISCDSCIDQELKLSFCKKECKDKWTSIQDKIQASSIISR